jgi:hypothetical protein
MEGSARVFAGEYQGATLTVPDRDPENPAWVVTPGGAWCRLLFLSGALTEVTDTGDVLRCRLADPTGAFDLVTGSHRSVVADVLQEIPVPSFVTVSGTAQCYQRNAGMVVTVRPDHVQPVDRQIRDAWVLDTAEQTIARLEQLLCAINGTSMNERALVPVRHYALTMEQLHEQVAMVGRAVQSVQSVAPVPAAGIDTTGIDTRGIVMEIMRAERHPRGIAVEEIIEQAKAQGITPELTLAAIRALIEDDECYQPQKGYLKPL